MYKWSHVFLNRVPIFKAVRSTIKTKDLVDEEKGNKFEIISKKFRNDGAYILIEV